MSGTAAVLNAHRAQDHPTGWSRYVYATNHKDIGTMYLWFAISAGVIGGALSILIRMELQEPGLQLFSNPHYYNVVVSAHGLTTINDFEKVLATSVPTLDVALKMHSNAN